MSEWKARYESATMAANQSRAHYQGLTRRLETRCENLQGHLRALEAQLSASQTLSRRLESRLAQANSRISAYESTKTIGGALELVVRERDEARRKLREAEARDPLAGTFAITVGGESYSVVVKTAIRDALINAMPSTGLRPIGDRAIEMGSGIIELSQDGLELNRLRSERDEARAEVERLKEWRDSANKNMRAASEYLDRVESLLGSASMMIGRSPDGDALAWMDRYYMRQRICIDDERKDGE